MVLGMSDLLSPFVVLFEDNADAFWCFEMLLRRMVCLLTSKFFWTNSLSALLLRHAFYASPAGKFSGGRTNWSDEAVASFVAYFGVHRQGNVCSLFTYRC